MYSTLSTFKTTMIIPQHTLCVRACVHWWVKCRAQIPSMCHTWLYVTSLCTLIYIVMEINTMGTVNCFIQNIFCMFNIRQKHIQVCNDTRVRNYDNILILGELSLLNFIVIDNVVNVPCWTECSLPNCFLWFWVTLILISYSIQDAYVN